MGTLLGMAKSLVPVAVLGALSILAVIGVKNDMTVEQALTLLFTAILVYLVPNKK